MEEINSTIPEYQPLQILWHSFVQPRLTNHPSHHDSLVTRELVSSFNVQSELIYKEAHKTRLQYCNQQSKVLCKLLRTTIINYHS